MAEKEEEHKGDEQDTLDQRITHRVDSGIHQLNAIVVGCDLHAGRKDAIPV